MAGADWKWALSEPRVSGFMFFDWQFASKMPHTSKVWAAMGECVATGKLPAECTLPAAQTSQVKEPLNV